MGQLWYLLLGMRPHQWLKNGLLFAGLIFAEKLGDLEMLARVAFAFVCFCLLAGSIYLLNDLRDLEKDRHHPEKKNRPLASGKLKTSTAWVGFGLAAGIGLIGAWLINVPFLICCVIYLAMTISYSMRLKHVAIIDLVILSLGFVIRALAGIAAVGEPTVSATDWFLACVWFLALFIVICKRRHELELLQGDAAHHREVLEEYSLPFLDQLVAIATTSTVLTYALYAIFNEKHSGIIYTLVFVVYGIFRYLHLVYHQREGGAPEKTVMRDPWTLVNVALWLAAMIYIFYFQQAPAPVAG